MGSNSAASITIFILSLSIFFFATLSSAQVPTVSPSSPPSPPPICPNMRVCATMLNNLAHAVVGSPQSEPCCCLISGLTDAEAVGCLCEVAKANVGVGGIDINIPVREILRVCERNAPNLAACA